MKNFPVKKYDVIVIDPPWDVPFHTPYQTILATDIAQMPLKSIMNKDCVVFIWTPNSQLETALSISRGWGLRYKQLVTWCKSYGLGRPPYTATEHVIMATKGSPKRPHIEYEGYTLFNWLYTKKKPKHSEKPDCFYDLIDKIFNGEKIDLFARKKREGWDAWGDEISDSKSIAVDEEGATIEDYKKSLTKPLAIEKIRNLSLRIMP